MSDQFKRTSDFCRAYNVKPITIWRWVCEGRLPQPTKIGNRNYWPANTEPLPDQKHNPTATQGGTT